jgi:carbonic anhydrase
MTRNLRTLQRILLLSTSFIAMASYAGEGAHWGYSGPSGPDHWAELSKEFAACAEGRNQSPIDIAAPVEADLTPIELRYSGQTATLLNNGHTIQVDVSPGNSLSTEGLEFELVQFHFHSPSENRIQGELFPLEAHFVHKGANGELAVLAVLFRSGAAEPGLESIWANIPEKAGERKPLDLALSGLGFIPKDLPYYRYSGSLTTPPCTEGVRWYVLKSNSTVSPEQASVFVDAIGENARAPQPLNSRLVLQ